MTTRKKLRVIAINYMPARTLTCLHILAYVRTTVAEGKANNNRMPYVAGEMEIIIMFTYVHTYVNNKQKEARVQLAE